MMEFTGNVIIDKQEKSERNLKDFRSAMRLLNPDAGFVDASLGNHRGDFGLEVVDAAGSTNPHPQIRVETKWLSDRGPVDLFSSLSSGYERIKKEFEFLSTLKAPLFLAQGKDSDFSEYTSPGGVTWSKTLKTLFSLNARFRVPMIWTDDACGFLAQYLNSKTQGQYDKTAESELPRSSHVIDKPDQLHDINERYGRQFFCGFKAPPEFNKMIIESILIYGCGFWFFDKLDPYEMRDAWLVHETRATSIHAAGGFTPNPLKYSGAIRTFGPGKNQYLPKLRKVRQKRKVCVSYSPAGDDPIFILLQPPRAQGCDIELLRPIRGNGDPVNPRKIMGIKDLAPHELERFAIVRDKRLFEPDLIPDILKRCHSYWSRDEQKPKIDGGEEVAVFEEFDKIEPEDLPGNPAIGPEMPSPEHFDVGVLPVDYPGVTLKTGMNSVVQKDGKISHYVDGVLVPEIKPETPPVYPPLYQKKTPLHTVHPEPPIIDWMTQLSLKLDLLSSQLTTKKRASIMGNLPVKSDQNLLNTSSPGEVEKALLEVCGLSKASPAMQIVALKMANRYGFSLELKHVIPVKGNLYITRDGLLHIAHKSGKLDGIEVIDEGKDVKGGWWAKVAVYRKDMSRPFSYKGRYNGPNKTFGPEMAIKCAESMCLRRAFDVSICSKEERWDVEEVKPVEPVKEVQKPVEPVEEVQKPRITVVAAEVLDAVPVKLKEMGKTYHDYDAKSSITDAFRKLNIPLEYQFTDDDGNPADKVLMLEAVAQYFGADSWGVWNPEPDVQVNAIYFLEFFAYVLGKINFDAALSFVDRNLIPKDSNAESHQKFLDLIKLQPARGINASVDEVYGDIEKALYDSEIPF